MKMPPLPVRNIRHRFWSLRSFSRAACHHGKFAALLAGSSLLAVGTLQASVEDDVASTATGAGSGGNVTLTNPDQTGGTTSSAYTNGQLPTSASDVTFTAAATYVVANFSIGKAFTFSSLNDLNATPITIVNGNGSTQAPLTLIGSDSVSGNTADLIYVAAGSFMTFSKNNTQSIVLGANGNFDVAGTLSVTANISGNFGLNVIGGGTLALGNANTFTGPLTINAGTVLLGGGPTAGSITSNIVINNNGVTTSGALIFNSSATQSVASVISGTGTVTGQGSGTTTLSGANTYSGATTINNGTLQFPTLNSMSASSAITVANGGTLAVNVGGTGQFTNGTSGAGTIGGIFAGIGGQGNSITLSAGSAVGIDTTNAAGGALTYAGNITNAGVGLTKQGAGTLTLTGANTYSGETTVLGGTLQAGSTTAFGSASMVFVANLAGATLNLNNNSLTIGSLSGGGTVGGGVTLGTGTLTLGSDNTSPLAYSGVISGTGGLVKVGTGTQTLSGFNTFTGGTTVNGGILSLSTGGGTGTVAGSVTVNAGAILSLNNQDAIGYNAGTSVTILNVNGGTVDEAVVPNATAGVSGNQGYLTSFNLTGGTVSSTGGGAYNFNIAAATPPTITSNASATTSLISGGIILRNTGTLLFNVAAGAAGTTNGSDLTISGAITQNGGTGGITKAGIGILTLTGTNTYPGVTTVNAGTLATSGTGTLGTGNVTISGTSKLTLGNSVSLNSAQSLIFAETSTINLGAGGTNNALATLLDSQNMSVVLNQGTYTATQLNNDFEAGRTIATFTGAGTLTITTGPVVPEPSTWLCALLAVSGAFGMALRRRARALLD